MSGPMEVVSGVGAKTVKEVSGTVAFNGTGNLDDCNKTHLMDLD